MQKVRIYHILSVMLMVAVATTACRKDYSNPNDATEQEVFENDRAAAGVALGLQRIYSTSAAGSLYAAINANGLTTLELKLLNQGNIGELQLETGGGAVDPTNNVINNIWTNSNKIIFDANNVLAYGRKTSDPSYAAGLIPFAAIYKAIALGNLSMFWEQVPDTIGQNVNFLPRVEGFKKAVATINEGIAAFNAAPMNNTIKGRLPADVDIINTLYALKARYSLFAGDYATALSAANQVNLAAKSTMSFTGTFTNAIFATATGPNNVFQPLDSTLGLPVSIAPDLNDKRIRFHARIEGDVTKPPRWRINGFYATALTQVPLYLPGEVTLIKAEALARQNNPDLDAALTELNKIVTKVPATDPFGLGADLPAISGPLTQAELLTEIYRNRSIELFMTGMRLEDSRRFGRPQAERRRNFFPYPFRERDNNPNTPADPAL